MKHTHPPIHIRLYHLGQLIAQSGSQLEIFKHLKGAKPCRIGEYRMTVNTLRDQTQYFFSKQP